MVSASNDDPEVYFSVSTIQIKPGKAEEVQNALNEVAADTFKNEPGALIYRSWKVEGKDEFVCIEKFASREAYKIHTTSDHVKRWADKYYFSGEYDLFEGGFIFHPLNSEGLPAGGFERT
ncbi:hypothetical protein CC79DRAFT_865842 [Sarocladium strictum]